MPPEPNDPSKKGEIDPSEVTSFRERVAKTQLPSAREAPQGLAILPVAEGRFQARWSLGEEALAAGLHAASSDPTGSRLVLRAFDLEERTAGYEDAGGVHDFPVNHINDSGYFDLPEEAPFVRAVLGVMNSEGRFKPILRSGTVALPLSPQPEPEPKTPIESLEETISEPEPLTGRQRADALAGAERPAPAVVLDEYEICARLNRLHGLPDELKVAAGASPAAVIAEADHPDLPGAITLPYSGALNETAVLESVRHALAAEIEQGGSQDAGNPYPVATVAVPAGSERSVREQNQSASGASEQLASQWHDTWTGKAPVELRAKIMLRAKLDPDTVFIVGGERVRPKPDGTILWKKEMHRFESAWPLLELACGLNDENVTPAIELLGDDGMVEPDVQRVIEIEGWIHDTDYERFLPDAIHRDGRGRFRLRCNVPGNTLLFPRFEILGSKDAI